ncbi:MAG: phosphoribosylformylglycinamidine cyclo-ligase [Proteobacteria bacterium]|nr:MAG: phosphoribosylformylglycinamidine cyclo-ligase [Pseudomonadota bacterium]
MSKRISYKDAGVDIDSADSAKQGMATALESRDPRVLNHLGAFASLFEAKFPGINEPVLVLKMEEPGSKQKLAIQHDRVEGVCFDLINHLINDIAVMGATPLAVLDVIVCGKLEKEIVTRLVKGMSEACRRQSCSLVGGETSEQPRVLPEGSYILAASVLGVVEKSKIIDGSKIREGDMILALASNGLHTNGYSLIRTLLESNPELAGQRVGETTFLDAILEPHLCYLPALRDLLESEQIKGMAHITGGGIPGNLNRILPKHLNAEIDGAAIKILPIFKKIRECAGLDDPEMLRTFNLGVGLCVVCEQSSVSGLIAHFGRHQIKAFEIGRIGKGSGQVEMKGGLSW